MESGTMMHRAKGPQPTTTDDPNILEAVRQIRQRTMEMRLQRTRFEAHWRDIVEYELPWRGKGLWARPNAYEVNDGTKKHGSIFNGTSEDAHEVLAAGMHSGLTSPARPWFRLTVPNAGVADSYEVKVWLAEVERLMMQVFARSNIYNCLHSMYHQLGGFGTNAVIIEEDFYSVIRGKVFEIGEFWIGADAQGRVDTFYRETWMTVGQIVSKFGKENCSATVQALYEKGSLEKPIAVCHMIEPNDDRIKLEIPPHFHWRSIYFEYGMEGNKILSLGGYEEFPCICPRWDVVGPNVWGYSPGMKVLADCKMLQKLERKSLVALDKVIDPPLTAPGSLKGSQINTMPGGLTHHDPTGGSPGLRPLYEIRPDLQAAENKIARVEARIQRGLFYDLFLMISGQPNPQQMTATEVLERHEEKLLMMGPVLERVHSEALSPLIDRTFNIMMRGGLIPTPPEEIQGITMRVEFISVLAQAQKMINVTALQQTMAFVGNLIAASPDALDKVDTDEAIELYADAVGVSPKLLRSKDDVAQIRGQRQEAQQKQQALDNAAVMAKSTKDLAGADTGTNNALTQLMGGGQPGATQAPVPGTVPGMTPGMGGSL